MKKPSEPKNPKEPKDPKAPKDPGKSKGPKAPGTTKNPKPPVSNDPDLPFEPACEWPDQPENAADRDLVDGYGDMDVDDMDADVDVAAVDIDAAVAASVGPPAVKPIAVMPGCLYLVGTPIGNLGDLSPRAAAILAAVDRVAAEDTRHTLRLLSALGIRKPMVSYHEHNVRTRGPELVSRLVAGETLALVSDAGMPSISDPGEDLVRLCIEASVPVTVVPGPTAAMTALALSGLPTGRFAFEGFLPVSGRDRRLRLAALLQEPRTLILYEAPHRLRKLLMALDAQGMGGRRIGLARELTKRFEEIERSTVAEALAASESRAPRGEYVVILEGGEAFAARQPMPGTTPGGRQVVDGSMGQFDGSGAADGVQSADNGLATGGDSARPLLLELLRSGLSVKDAAREAARRTGLKRSALYGLAMALKEKERI